jgi:hypothetical protein
VGCAERVPIEGSRCSPEHVCPKGYVCKAGFCKPLAIPKFCASDEDCLGGVCNPETRFCVKCLVNADCPSGVCAPVENFCVPCLADRDCVTGVCDVASRQCRSCTADIQCHGGVCGPDGICVWAP